MLVAELSAALGAFSALIALLWKLLVFLRKARHLSASKSRVIAVVSGKIPECLKDLPDFSSYRSARNARADLVLLWDPPLKVALKCDFICGDVGSRIRCQFPPDSEFWDYITADSRVRNGRAHETSRDLS